MTWHVEESAQVVDLAVYRKRSKDRNRRVERVVRRIREVRDEQHLLALEALVDVLPPAA